jgi:hypothetical protein
MKTFHLIVLIIFVLALVACSSTTPGPTATSTATLVPTATITFTPIPPTATKTPTPSATPTLTPISTATFTNIPTRTPTEVVFGMKEDVKGEEWGIRVLSAEYKGPKYMWHAACIWFELDSRIKSSLGIGTEILLVKINLSNLTSKAIEKAWLRSNVVVRNRQGVLHPCDFAANYLQVGRCGSTRGFCTWDGQSPEDAAIFKSTFLEATYLFFVEKNTILDFIWSNLPPVRLKITKD